MMHGFVLQAEDSIRDGHVTGVQTCALPISTGANAAEPVERRAGTKGNADRQSTHWTQSQARVSQALERIRQAVAVTHPRWEPHAGKPHVRICAGGARQLASLPLKDRKNRARFSVRILRKLVRRC